MRPERLGVTRSVAYASCPHSPLMLLPHKVSGRVEYISTLPHPHLTGFKVTFNMRLTSADYIIIRLSLVFWLFCTPTTNPFEARHWNKLIVGL